MARKGGGRGPRGEGEGRRERAERGLPCRRRRGRGGRDVRSAGARAGCWGSSGRRRRGAPLGGRGSSSGRAHGGAGAGWPAAGGAAARGREGARWFRFGGKTRVGGDEENDQVILAVQTHMSGVPGPGYAIDIQI